MCDQNENVPKKLHPNNIWLRSCDEEILDPIEGQVSGTIPEWIKGSLLRNGAGKGSFGPDTFKHVFDKSALLHRFAISGGQVTYQCRFIQTNCYTKNSTANRIVVTEFGTKSSIDPCQTIFEKISTIFNTGESMSDNAMISIYPFGDEFFAFAESPVMFKIDEKTLETKKRVNLYQQFGIIHHTSHPHVVENGDVFNLGTLVTTFGPKYCIIHFPENGKMIENAKICASIYSSKTFEPGYMHTFGITENYFVLIEQPLCMSAKNMGKAIWKNDPLIDTLKWYEDRPTKIHVLSRETGKLYKTFHASTFFFFHVINSFEEDNRVILDICCFDNPDIINGLLIENLSNLRTNPDYSKTLLSKPLRFILPLSKDSKDLIIPEELCDLPCDLPQINYIRHSGRPYRYFYALTSDFSNPGTIIKVDILSKTWITWSEENCYPGEPVFVEAPNPMSEDDGVVLSVFLRGAEEENRVGLVILCAKSLKELGRCEFLTSSPVPRCVHGWFTSNK